MGNITYAYSYIKKAKIVHKCTRCGRDITPNEPYVRLARKFYAHGHSYFKDVGKRCVACLPASFLKELEKKRHIVKETLFSTFRG